MSSYIMIRDIKTVCFVIIGVTLSHLGASFSSWEWWVITAAVGTASFPWEIKQ
jgi:hypothetical protein